MFSQASVILSTGGGCVWQTPPKADTPPLDRHFPGQTPPGQTPPGHTPQQTPHWASTALGRHLLCRHPRQIPLGRPPQQTPSWPVHAGIHTPCPAAATAADGTHHTGMHPCFSKNFLPKARLNIVSQTIAKLFTDHSEASALPAGCAWSEGLHLYSSEAMSLFFDVNAPLVLVL